MQENASNILPDIRDEARRLTTSVLDAGLHARLLGGLAIWLRCPSVRIGPFARSYQDMDFAIAKGAGSVFKAFLTSEGYLGDPFFNGLHGDTRLYFQAPDSRWSIDVVIDELTMSHKLDLRGRLDGPLSTLTLADLLLSKLQVWEINRKDLGDALCLLADHGEPPPHPQVAGWRLGLLPHHRAEPRQAGRVVGRVATSRRLFRRRGADHDHPRGHRRGP